VAKADPAELHAVVEEVEDPALFASLGALGVIAAIDAADNHVRVAVRTPFEIHPAHAELESSLTLACRKVNSRIFVELVTIPMSERESDELGDRLHAIDSSGEAKADRVLSIASGKGGVGKSTVTVNLAVALARLGHSVGLLDADVYGFSVPRMLGVVTPPVVLGRTVIPAVANGVRCVSMGFFVEEDRAIAWRGPMLHKTLERFVNEVHWGTSDFLLIDMPPGTGDVALSVAQHLPGAELYVVTTPQPAAERVAQRAGALARELRIPVRGVIENMSWFTAPGGERLELFGSGGGADLADALGVEVLASIPFDPSVRAGADEGLPASVVDGSGPVALAFAELARRVDGLGPAKIFRSELRIS